MHILGNAKLRDKPMALAIYVYGLSMLTTGLDCVLYYAHNPMLEDFHHSGEQWGLTTDTPVQQQQFGGSADRA